MVAIVAFVIVAALGMFTFLIYAERDISPLANLLLTFVAVATGAGVTYAKAGTVQRVVEEVKANVNGRMTQLIEKAAAAGHDVTVERQHLVSDDARSQDRE
jgi:hypothetical protein